MSRLNMARKIKELHRNSLNTNNIDYNNQQINEQNQGKKYILSKMKDAYGQKGNYHLNEYNIEYSPNIYILDKANKNNNIKVKNNKNNNVIIKKRGKSSYSPNIIENEDISINKEINKDKKIENSFFNNMSNINNNDDEKNKRD